MADGEDKAADDRLRRPPLEAEEEAERLCEATQAHRICESSRDNRVTVTWCINMYLACDSHVILNMGVV